MANPFVHIELSTDDLGKAKTFYGALLGWNLKDEEMPDGTYTMIDVGEGTGGGMVQGMNPGAPPAWMPYIGVDDVKASTEKVKALGGKVHRDVTEIPGMGSFSIVADPSGAVFGLWTTAGGAT